MFRHRSRKNRGTWIPRNRNNGNQTNHDMMQNNEYFNNFNNYQTSENSRNYTKHKYSAKHSNKRKYNAKSTSKKPYNDGSQIYLYVYTVRFTMI